MVQPRECQLSNSGQSDNPVPCLTEKDAQDLLLCPSDHQCRQQDGRRRLKTNASNRQDFSSTLCTHLTTDKSLSSDHPSVRVKAASDFHAEHQALAHGLSATLFQNDSTAWRQWFNFYKYLEMAWGGISPQTAKNHLTLVLFLCTMPYL